MLELMTRDFGNAWTEFVHDEGTKLYVRGLTNGFGGGAKPMELQRKTRQLA